MKSTWHAGARFIRAALALSIIFIIPTAAHAVDCNNLSPVRDTYLSNDARDSSHGTDGFVLVGSPGSGIVTATLLHYDVLGRCPEIVGSKITSAVLSFTKVSVNPSEITDLALQVRRAHAPWSNAATWNRYEPELDVTIGSLLLDVVPASPSTSDPDLGTLVQQWAAGTTPEYGLSLSADVADGKAMTARSIEGDAIGVRLSLSYDPLPLSSLKLCNDLSPVLDTHLLSNEPDGSHGSDAFVLVGSPESDVAAATLLHYDVLGRCPGITGAIVTSAVLSFTKVSVSPPEITDLALQLRRAHASWSDSTTWNAYEPQFDETIGSILLDLVPATPSTSDSDLRALVQQWAAGTAPEYGLSLTPEVADGKAMTARSTEGDSNGVRLSLSYLTECATQDFDGGGHSDILWRNTTTGDVGAWLLGDGGAVTGWVWLATEPPSSGWEIEGVGDFTGDGAPDVLWRNKTTGEVGAWVVNTSVVEDWVWMPTEPPASGWQIEGVGDFTDDGSPDVLWRNETTGEVGAWIMNGPAVEGWVWMPTEPPASGWQIQGVSDINCDGPVDVLWRHTGTGAVGAWVMDATAVAGWLAIATEPPSSGWEIAALIDVTGDCCTDVVWRNTETGQTGAWVLESGAVVGWIWLATEPPETGWEIQGPR